MNATPAVLAERIYDLADDLAAVDRKIGRLWEQSPGAVQGQLEAICSLPIGDAYLAVKRLKALADRLSAEPTSTTHSYREAAE